MGLNPAGLEPILLAFHGRSPRNACLSRPLGTPIIFPFPRAKVLRCQPCELESPGLAMSESLRGHCLIAAKRLRDPNFYKTVVLMVEHGADGQWG